MRVADDAQTALAPHQGLGTLVVDEDVVARFVDVVFDEGRRQALLPVQQNEAGTAHDLRELGDTDAGPDGVEVGEPVAGHEDHIGFPDEFGKVRCHDPGLDAARGRGPTDEAAEEFEVAVGADRCLVTASGLRHLQGRHGKTVALRQRAAASGADGNGHLDEAFAELVFTHLLEDVELLLHDLLKAALFHDDIVAVGTELFHDTGISRRPGLEDVLDTGRDGLAFTALIVAIHVFLVIESHIEDTGLGLPVLSGVALQFRVVEEEETGRAGLFIEFSGIDRVHASAEFEVQTAAAVAYLLERYIADELGDLAGGDEVVPHHAHPEKVIVPDDVAVLPDHGHGHGIALRAPVGLEVLFRRADDRVVVAPFRIPKDEVCDDQREENGELDDPVQMVKGIQDQCRGCGGQKDQERQNTTDDTQRVIPP